MDDFSLPHVSNTYGYLPSVSNFIRPYKRPQSSISPLVIYDDKSGVVRLVVGASGGSTIISGTAYVSVKYFLRESRFQESRDKSLSLSKLGLMAEGCSLHRLAPFRRGFRLYHGSKVKPFVAGM